MNGRIHIRESQDNPRDVVKEIRDSALLALDSHGFTTGQIVAMNVQDINFEYKFAITTYPRSRSKKVVELSEQDLGKLRRWLSVRQLMKPSTDAVFVSLHWTDAIAKPGERIGARGCRQTLSKIHKIEEDRATMSVAVAA